MDNVIPDVFKEFQDIVDSTDEIHPSVPGWEQGSEMRILTPEVRSDFQEFEGKEVVVFGNPVWMGEHLDHLQGDNPYFAKGNCGLVTVANFLNLSGILAADENLITKYAIDNDLCIHGWFVSPFDRGGTTQTDLRDILQDFGVDTYAFEPFESGGAIEDIANQIEAGHVGALGVNAGYLWDEPAYVGDGFFNHWVTLTGTIRDTDTGELLGLTICDSGNGKACDVLTIDKLRACYETVPAAQVIFSASPVRYDHRV